MFNALLNQKNNLTGSYKHPLSSEKQPSINCRFQPDIDADYFVIAVKKSKKSIRGGNISKIFKNPAV